MRKSFHIHNYGKSAILTSWTTSVNKPSLTNRLYYILEEGAGYIENGKKHYFLKNHIYLLSHSAKATYFIENKNFSHAHIDYTDDFLSSYDKIIDIPVESNKLIKLDVDTFMNYLEREFNKNPGHHKFTDENERISLILTSFLYDIDEIYTPNGVTNPAVAKSIKYIHTNFAKSISVEELAGRVFLSKNHLTNLFLRETGYTPYQYIKEYRFDIALSMLRDGLPVATIAEKCGFQSSSAFSNSFRKKFGHSPLKSRKA